MSMESDRRGNGPGCLLDILHLPAIIIEIAMEVIQVLASSKKR